MLRLLETLFGTNKIVVLDSGFCVLEALIELKKRAIFAAAVIKKRRYWLKHIKGDDIKAAKSVEPLGTQSRLPGKLDNVPFDIFTSNEPDYVMMFMATYGTIFPKADQEKTKRIDANGSIIEFHHCEVIANHYKYRDAVDAHNAKRHDGGTGQGISIETTWTARHWPNRVFAFILGVCEVNTYLGLRFFRDYNKEQMVFRRELARALISNIVDEENKVTTPESDRDQCFSDLHQKVDWEPYSIWTNRGWEKKFKFKYQQKTCSTKGCKKKTRIYCRCFLGVPRCADCFIRHCSDSLTYK